MSRVLRIAIAAIITLLVLLFLGTRKDFVLNNDTCDSCINEQDCEKFCSGKCIKKFLDKVTYSGEMNQSIVYCSCICKSSIREFLT